MSIHEISKESFRELADAVIKELLQQRDDPFVTPTLVFHNTKAAQWFKAYYLVLHNFWCAFGQ